MPDFDHFTRQLRHPLVRLDQVRSHWHAQLILLVHNLLLELVSVKSHLSQAHLTVYKLLHQRRLVFLRLCQLILQPFKLIDKHGALFLQDGTRLLESLL